LPPNRKDGLSKANLLTEDAFLPKLFNIQIETGNFLLPADVGDQVVPSLVPSLTGSKPYLKWSRRLIFDISPYPPQSEWTKLYGGFRTTKKFLGSYRSTA